MSADDAPPPNAAVTPPLVATPISASIASALEATLAARAPEKRGAASVTATLQGIEARAAVRIREGWEAGVWGASDWHGRPSVGARVQGSW